MCRKSRVHSETAFEFGISLSCFERRYNNIRVRVAINLSLVHAPRIQGNLGAINLHNTAFKLSL